MSSRHFRKMNKQNNLPPPPDDSDDDYQPLYTRTSGASKYAGLEVSSSHSESEKVSEKSEEEDISHGYSLYPGFTNNKKKNKKKGKGKGKAAAARGLDEVERAQREVNAILGCPPPAPPQPTVNQALEVLTVDPKHLNVANELRRIFGPEEAGRRPRLPPHRALSLKRVIVHPNKDTPMYDFYGNGLTMMKYKEVDDRKYYVFNHDDAYQKTHRLFLKRLAHARSSADIIMLNFDHAKQFLHVEALLEISDRLFRMEENGLANEILENVVTFLQYSAHPNFLISQNNVRLEYKFLENRPFHCAMLKYIYLLTNKACHRTALEIAKMMLLIDPHDPLAVISVIDILALRCREHEWLIETVKYFDRQREASLLFNIKYSISLANFHVAHKNNRDLAEADRLIREAILAFPHIFVKILECSHVSNPELVGHEIFKPDPPTPWRAGASEVFMIYAKMTFPRWNEPAVMKWLMRNATELCAEYKTNAKIRETAKDWAISRHSLYQVWPQEYLRHLSVFSSVSKLIIDTPLTAAVFQQPTCAFDPLFDKSVNRYEYSYKLDAPAPTFDSNGNPLISHVFRNEFYKLFAEGERAKRNNPYPTMTAHCAEDKPRNRNATRPNAMPNDPPLSTTIYFWPKATTGMSPEQAAATNYANWQGVYVQQNMNPCKVNYTGHCIPPFPPSIDWDFDDCDGEFDAYDYADDAENFLRDEKAMEEALASGGADDDMDQETIDAMDALYFDQRLRTILSLYLRNVLCLHENAATVVYHIFIMMCYTMPLMGAILADNFIGRYKVILYFSIIYLIGTVLTCCAAIPPLMLPPTTTSMIGLLLIATGTGGIKPCVAAFGGDQFRLPEENQLLQKFFSTFYCTVNLGGFMGMVVTPALRRSVMCFGDDACYALGFGFPALLVLISIVIFVAGKPSYRIKQPRDNVTLKFISCAWYAIIKRIKYSPERDGPPRDHWLDYAVDKYGEKLIADMKVVFSILYLYLPVPIFWSLFDQQGSRWTFQASRLRSEVFGVTLMPDQLQVMNPAMVLLMIPVCPGGAWPLLPDMPPLQKMFVGGMLASLAFVSAGILQIGIERSTLQVPGHRQTGLVIMNTLGCQVDVVIRGEGIATVEQHGTALMTPLPHKQLYVTATSPENCAGRVMKKHVVTQEFKSIARMFMPVVIGQNSDDQIAMYFMDPNPFVKSLTGKPKLKVVYVGETGPNKNVSIAVETEKRLSDIYYVSDRPVDHIGESAYMCLQPDKFRWQALSADGEMSGSGEGYLRAGGVYVLCLRERMGRLDAAVLHAPNPPNELHLAWIVPQYLLVSVAEIMFAVSGLEFSFTQAPKSMKTITIAAWYVSVAFGNLIVILVAQTKIFQCRATEFFVYAAMLAIAMLLFLWMAQDYESRNIDADGSSSESRPLLHHRSKVISVHSLSASSTHPFAGTGSSAASCLGMMERSRPAAWPQRAYVHLATPSTGEHKATTLAQE